MIRFGLTIRVNQTIIGRKKGRELCVNFGAPHKANDFLADVVIIFLRPPRKDPSKTAEETISVPFNFEQGAFVLQLRIHEGAPWVPFQAAPPLPFWLRERCIQRRCSGGLAVVAPGSGGLAVVAPANAAAAAAAARVVLPLLPLHGGDLLGGVAAGIMIKPNQQTCPTTAPQCVVGL